MRCPSPIPWAAPESKSNLVIPESKALADRANEPDGVPHDPQDVAGVRNQGLQQAELRVEHADRHLHQEDRAGENEQVERPHSGSGLRSRP